jgi:hypothetical protein
MTNKEILRNIILEDGIENVSLNESNFVVYFGDVINTNNEGEKYTLLGTYVEMNYEFESVRFKLHRAVVDVLETDIRDNYSYSGFVHYNGSIFCYGESGIDYTAGTIRTEGLTSDLFNRLLIQFHNYLSNSSHNTMGYYRRINLGVVSNSIYKIKQVVTINGFNYPRTLEKIYTSTTISGLKYEEPFEVILEKPEKEFGYNNEIITPKIVKHQYKEEVVETKEEIGVSNVLDDLIKKKLINDYENEINSKPEINAENFLHQLTDKYSRVDGCFYI